MPPLDRLLTAADLPTLKVGELVYVLWSGGNWPHQYVVIREGRNPWVVVPGFSAPQHPLEFVGPPPLTAVWRA